MRDRSWKVTTAAGVMALLALVVGVTGAQAQAPEVEIPKPGVPEIFTLEGEFVRIAYNNEGYASLGYRLANESAGEEWMLLEVGLTIRHKVKDFKLARTALTLDTPQHRGIALATQAEYQGAGLQGLDRRASMVTSDSINYFPPEARNACALSFFRDMTTRGVARDVTELSPQRACLGRIYFKVPEGIQHGQHFLNVQFEKSLVRVPFRILTKEEEELLGGKWKDIKKEHEEAFQK